MSSRHLPRTHATLVHILADAAARDPSAEALICQNQHLSYAEYFACVCGFARELEALGARGEHVTPCSSTRSSPVSAHSAPSPPAPSMFR